VFYSNRYLPFRSIRSVKYTAQETRPFMNLDEAAPLVGLKPPTLRRAIRQGKLPYSKPGRAYLVKLDHVVEWLENEMRRGGVKLRK
jgi:excisionase family DNA binding protein